MGILIIVNNVEHDLLFSRDGIILTNANGKTIIQKSDISSLHTKNEEPLLLKIKSKDNKNYIFKFENSYTKEIIKSLLLLIITTKDVYEEILKNEKDISTAYDLLVQNKVLEVDKFWSIFETIIKEYKKKSINTSNYTLEIENTKESLLNLFLDIPIMLYVYCEMNITLSQFYNIFKQSNFYDIKNECNSIDRLISKYFVSNKEEKNYAKRINNFSEMIVQEHNESKINIKEQKITEAEFEPIYPFEDIPLNDVEALPSDIHDNGCNIDFVIEEEERNYKLNKNQLNKMLLISKIIFKAKSKNIKELDQYAIEISEKYISSLEKETGYKNLREYCKRILPINFISKNQK
ncbi:hypothetical protein SLOPH_2122 [Spraguea lophii 42_110]|uniref:Uncharacterized protein n=1 Tax=Spraguea lophii (strain 42_110) TaxID=1358809 RepID=S7W7E9_SPRLO|nr:hypothetical protein SLOPH_2122 [Spraguea lophii 42_110]